MKESRDVAARAFPFPQCGPGSILALYHMWVELLVLALLRGFFAPGYSSFPPTKKPNMSNFQLEQDRGPTWKPAKADDASSLNISFY